MGTARKVHPSEFPFHAFGSPLAGERSHWKAEITHGTGEKNGGEKCAAIFATLDLSGGPRQKGIIKDDKGKCSSDFRSVDPAHCSALSYHLSSSSWSSRSFNITLSSLGFRRFKMDLLTFHLNS